MAWLTKLKLQREGDQAGQIAEALEVEYDDGGTEGFDRSDNVSDTEAGFSITGRGTFSLPLRWICGKSLRLWVPQGKIMVAKGRCILYNSSMTSRESYGS